jgi:elongation factor Ts
MSIELIKSIRNQTGLPFKDIKKAIEELKTDSEEKIITHLREQGLFKSQSRQDRSTNQGGIFTYSHESRLGVMLEIKCETDFVSRNEAFKELGLDLCLHIIAYQPQAIDETGISQEYIEKELSIAKTQLLNEGKDESKIEMILTGKKNKIVSESSLIKQPFLKDPKLTVEQYIASVSQSTGEKIVVSRFVVYNLI